MKLEKVYNNSHQKKYAMKKSTILKIGSKSFNNFYLEFIKLVTKFKFKKEMLL